MEKVLHAEVRSKVGKVSARQLREKGRIPCVVYGEGSPLHVSISEREFNKVFKTISESSIIALNIDGKTENVLLKDFQDNIIENRIDHMDFFKVSQDRELRTHVHVQPQGTPIGVKEGGIMELLTHTLEIVCLPKDLPDVLTVDVSHLALGQTLHLSELTLPKGVKVHGAPDQAIVHVTHAKSAYVEPTAEDATSAETAASAAEAK